MSVAASEDPYWSREASALAAALESGAGGLSSDRAAARLAVVGANSVDESSSLSALRLLLRQFESPLAGARAMSGRGVIIRRLDAIENLGSMDVLCTDETGTLTEGAIVLNDALDPADRPSAEVRRLAFLNAAFETGIENLLDAAIVAAGESAELTTRGVSKIDEIPYDFLRRRLTIVVSEDGAPSQHLIVTKGAFCNVLDICSRLERDGVEVPLDAEKRVERGEGALQPRRRAGTDLSRVPCVSTTLPRRTPRR